MFVIKIIKNHQKSSKFIDFITNIIKFYNSLIIKFYNITRISTKTHEIVQKHMKTTIFVLILKPYKMLGHFGVKRGKILDRCQGRGKCSIWDIDGFQVSKELVVEFGALIQGRRREKMTFFYFSIFELFQHIQMK